LPPASPRDRKARGEVLWVDPATKNEAAHSRRGSYVPNENSKFAEAVERILESAKPGTLLEWELASGSSVLRNL
jgi:hypothetical protein